MKVSQITSHELSYRQQGKRGDWKETHPLGKVAREIELPQIQNRCLLHVAPFNYYYNIMCAQNQNVGPQGKVMSIMKTDPH